MRAQFRVTFETVTDESAEQGSAASHGFVNRFGDCVDLESVDLSELHSDGLPLFVMTLREALDLLGNTRGPWIEAREPSDSSGRARWVTVYGARDCGESESRSIHLPEHVTAATSARLVRLAMNGGRT